MQIVELKIEDNYIESVLTLLKSLKEDMIKEITIKKPSFSDDDRLKEFYSLIRKGDNEVILTKKNAIDTDEIYQDYKDNEGLGA